MKKIICLIIISLFSSYSSANPQVDSAVQFSLLKHHLELPGLNEDVILSKLPHLPSTLSESVAELGDVAAEIGGSTARILLDLSFSLLTLRMRYNAIVNNEIQLANNLAQLRTTPSTARLPYVAGQPEQRIKKLAGISKERLKQQRAEQKQQLQKIAAREKRTLFSDFSKYYKNLSTEWFTLGTDVTDALGHCTSIDQVDEIEQMLVERALLINRILKGLKSTTRCSNEALLHAMQLVEQAMGRFVASKEGVEQQSLTIVHNLFSSLISVAAGHLSPHEFLQRVLGAKVSKLEKMGLWFTRSSLQAKSELRWLQKMATNKRVSIYNPSVAFNSSVAKTAFAKSYRIVCTDDFKYLDWGAFLVGFHRLENCQGEDGRLFDMDAKWTGFTLGVNPVNGIILQFLSPRRISINGTWRGGFRTGLSLAFGAGNTWIPLVGKKASTLWIAQASMGAVKAEAVTGIVTITPKP